MGAFCGRCFQETLNDRGVCLVCSYDGAANREAFPMALPPGSILYGRYIVGRVLGQGGFGITYTARDYQTGQTVAIKEFFPDTMATRSGITVRPFAGERGENFPYGRDVFLEEARVLAEFQGHPNIVQVHVYFEENNTAYFVMEYVSGADLRRYIASHGGRLSWQEASRILLPVMDALSAVHSKGIIHRDIAPDNIYISDTGQVKLLDFGASRYSLGNVSHSLDVILKPGYTPKEQYRRRSRQGPYTDVYSLGATFYYAITGVRPDEALDRDEEDTLPYPSSLGARVTAEQEEVLLKAMAVEPGDRYQTMHQFHEAVLDPPPLLKPEPKPVPVPEPDPAPTPQPEPVPDPEPGPDPGTKRKLPKWLLPVGAAAILAVVALGIFGGGEKEPAATEAPEVEVILHTEPAEQTQPVQETVPSVTDPEETQPSGGIAVAEINEEGIPLNALAEYEYVEDRGFEEIMQLPAFGTQALRHQVATITFLDSLAGVPEMAVDASHLKNGRVKAWAVKRQNLNLQTKQPEDGNTEAALEFVSSELYDVYVAAEAGVYAPVNANFLFAAMPNLTAISFGDAFHTEYTTQMAQMFSQDKALTALDVTGFDTANVTNMHCMFQSCEALTELDISGFDTGSVEYTSFLFQNCRNLKSLNMGDFDTANVTSMKHMFHGCEALTALDVSGFDTAKVTDMVGMFEDCSSLTQLDVSLFDTGNVTDMTSMFDGCAALTQLDVGGFDTASVTSMNSMFQSCSGLKKLDVSGFDTEKCTNLQYMFYGCEALEYLDVSRFNTAEVTTLRCMFANCMSLENLNLTGFSTAKVTDMTGMFQHCEAMTEINISNFNTQKVKEMRNMFRSCLKLTKLNIGKFETNKVGDMTCMFWGCSSLEELNLAKFKSNKDTVLTGMFTGCENLKTFKCSDSRIKKVYQDR